MKNIDSKSQLAFILLFLSFSAVAQGAPPATPIDGGLSLLLAVGALFGIKKIRDKRNH